MGARLTKDRENSLRSKIREFRLLAWSTNQIAKQLNIAPLTVQRIECNMSYTEFNLKYNRTVSRKRKDGFSSICFQLPTDLKLKLQNESQNRKMNVNQFIRFCVRKELRESDGTNQAASRQSF